MVDLSLTAIIILFASAFLGGFVDSVAGGGGIITVPVLMAVGLPPHLALGTNKLQASFGSFTAAMNYRRGGMFRFRELVQGIVCTALGALIGTLTIQALSADLLTYAIPPLLLAVFVYMLCHPQLGREERVPRCRSAIFYLVFGLLLGFYDGAFGPGTGSFWMIAFAFWLGFDLKKATAHTKVMNFTSNIVSLATFLIGGHVVILIGLLMGVAQVGGAWLGSHMVLKRGAGLVRTFFLVVVAVTIARLLCVTYF